MLLCYRRKEAPVVTMESTKPKLFRISYFNYRKVLGVPCFNGLRKQIKK